MIQRMTYWVMGLKASLMTATTRVRESERESDVDEAESMNSDIDSMNSSAVDDLAENIVSDMDSIHSPITVLSTEIAGAQASRTKTSMRALGMPATQE
jgi:hypothetical protein